MAIQIRRREFITLLGGAVAWPPAVRAQQAQQMRRIGVLMGWDESDPEAQSNLTAFATGLDGQSQHADRHSLVRWQR